MTKCPGSFSYAPNHPCASCISFKRSNPSHAMLKKLPTGSYLEAGDNEATEQELQDVAFTAFSISVIAFTILVTITIYFFT